MTAGTYEDGASLAEGSPEAPAVCRQYFTNYLTQHGRAPGRNEMERALTDEPFQLKREHVRREWRLLTGRGDAEEASTPALEAELHQLRAMVEALVQELREVRTAVAKLEARVASQDQALHALNTTLSSLAKTVEVCQQMTMPLVQLGQFVRTHPGAARTVMAIIRQHSHDTRDLFFWLADEWGLPVDANDQQYRQALFTQGGLAS